MDSIKEIMTDELTLKAVQQGIILSVILIFIGGLFTRLSTKLIHKIYHNRFYKVSSLTRKKETILKLITNLIKYFIWFLVIIGILKSFKVNTDAILTGAGILGVAVGLGAQNIVKDLIAGFFIIFEDQFSIGDVVETNGFMGEVIEVGLKSTRIKAWTGEIKIVPNGNITEVINYSQSNALAVVDFSLPVNVDIEEVESIINSTLPTLKDKYSEIINEPEILGITFVEDSILKLRITAEVKSMEHYHIQRVIYKEVLKSLKNNNIELPIKKYKLDIGDING